LVSKIQELKDNLVTKGEKIEENSEKTKPVKTFTYPAKTGATASDFLSHDQPPAPKYSDNGRNFK
jgi:hypothetical protein